MRERIYIACDLKSFYASVECIERSLDPLSTNLVVADQSRTDKTICLAVSPSLKAYGIPGRPRLFEVIQQMRDVNTKRLTAAPGNSFSGSSFRVSELAENPALEATWVVAPPRMAFYIEYSTKIYNVYLKYVAPEDIHVYSIDEVFIDLTAYLHTYGCTAYELTAKIMRDVYKTTGITATAGIGTNLYLCKVAMDITAKHSEPDEFGARIAFLDERTYRQQLWSHRPLTDFWRVGPGYAKKLAEFGIDTMGAVARCSVGGKGDFYNEELLYRLFGVNAELLIDHAWGWEPCTIADIRAYHPQEKSLGSGQVLPCSYDTKAAKLIVLEMTGFLVLDLVDKGLLTDHLTLNIGYDNNDLKKYCGELKNDRYGRKTPKPAHGVIHLDRPTASDQQITEAVSALFDRIINKKLLVRRVNITAEHLIPESSLARTDLFDQMTLFSEEKVPKQDMQTLRREKQKQQAVLNIQKRFGKNAIMKGMSLQKEARASERNQQIGGHKA